MEYPQISEKPKSDTNEELELLVMLMENDSVDEQRMKIFRYVNL